MKEYLASLQKSHLFAGMTQDEIGAMLHCLRAEKAQIKKGEMLLLAGEPVERLGIVLEGNVQVVREDASGTRVLLAHIKEGDYFGEALCCAGVTESPVSVVSIANGMVLWIAFHRILTVCSGACDFHARLIANMLRIMAVKNLYLQERVEIISKKTIRERVLAYLTLQIRQYGENFTIPLDRAALADFLCTDRSALSRELGNLRSEGVLSFYKNEFVLLRDPD